CIGQTLRTGRPDRQQFHRLKRPRASGGRPDPAYLSRSGRWNRQCSGSGTSGSEAQQSDPGIAALLPGFRSRKLLLPQRGQRPPTQAKTSGQSGNASTFPPGLVDHGQQNFFPPLLIDDAHMAVLNHTLSVNYEGFRSAVDPEIKAE